VLTDIYRIIQKLQEYIKTHSRATGNIGELSILKMKNQLREKLNME